MLKKKILFFGLTILVSNITGYSQGNYNTVPKSSISFGSIDMSTTFNEVVKTFGEPIKRSTYTYQEGDGPDGFDEQYHFTYEKFEIRFLKYYGDVRFSSCSIRTPSLPLKTGKKIIRVGDGLDKLRDLYPLSFGEFVRTKSESIFIYIKNADGFISFKIENEKVISITIDLDPA